MYNIKIGVYRNPCKWNNQPDYLGTKDAFTHTQDSREVQRCGLRGYAVTRSGDTY
ncbi:hypothetical protein KL86SPO_20276 [uncultured Sporomusa sp.]|uniref:Uncharacterized protein n=1 Tax=uncultured Sporomusa sp. TaxID=307249 RepID=A0A212LN51_9FIRM|nr:hypothetical protein KL86SPO_20276 [uncultured Sporomusa sp.]